jgi:hypothetical protein
MIAPDPALQPRPSRRPGVLWLSISGAPNTLLDGQLRRFLFTRSPTAVVLNGAQQGYGDLVGAIKSEFPAIKVLRYANAQLIPKSERVASTMYEHFIDADHVDTQVLKRRNGNPMITGDGTIWTDITEPDTRRFIARHLRQQVELHGVDGVAIDSFHARLRQAEVIQDGEQKDAEWPRACERLLNALRERLPDKLIWFNGIWSFRDEAQAAEQAALLNRADGAEVEFYGYDGTGRVTTNTYEVFVERINPILEAHPTKSFLVRGTAPGLTYFDYAKDLRQARYCFGCYLLAKTPHSFFSYGQSFQLQRLPKERTGGAAWFSYFDLPLGDPVEAARPNGSGGWSRRYQGGIVLVAPAERGRQSWDTNSDLWTTLGVKLAAGTRMALEEGDALVLLNDQPQPPPTEVDINLADSTTEWLVEGVTGEYRYAALALRVSSTSAASAVLVRFETDDPDEQNPRRPFGILEVISASSEFPSSNADYPYGLEPTLGALHVRSTRTYPTSGTSTDIVLNLESECAPYPCFRVISVRTIGDVRVDLIRLGKPTPIVDAG